MGDKVKFFKRQFEDVGRKEKYEQMTFMCSVGTRYEDMRERGIVLERLQRYVTHGSQGIIDLGAGSGRWSRNIAALGYQVFGVDISHPQLLHAAKNMREKGVEDRCHFAVGNMQELPIKSEVCEALNCIRVLKYADDPFVVLREVYRVLQPGGTFIFSFPNKATYHVLLIAWWKIRGQQSGRFFTHKELQTRLEETGFEVLEMVGTLRLPRFFYHAARNDFALSILKAVEKTLSLVLPRYWLYRFFFVFCRKPAHR